MGKLVGCITDVCSHALGVEAFPEEDKDETKIYPLIVKDSPLPCSEEDTFSTRHDNQTSICFPVYEMEARSREEILDPDLGRKIGEVVIKDLPAGRPKGQPSEVTFDLDASFCRHVTAIDMKTGKKVEADFDIRSGLDEEKKARTTKMLDGAVIQS